MVLMAAPSSMETGKLEVGCFRYCGVVRTILFVRHMVLMRQRLPGRGPNPASLLLRRSLPSTPDHHRLCCSFDPYSSSRLWHLRRLQDDAFDDTWVPSESVCVGHNPDDVQPLHDLFASPSKDASSVSEASSLAEGGGHGGVSKDHQETGGVGLRGGRVTGAVASSPKTYYTNAELYQLLDPNGNDLPYVYDNFEWPHCDVS